MILARILFPCAKLALAEQARGTLLAHTCGLAATESFAEDDLYATMDLLTGHWAALEKELYRATFPQGASLILYDLTSVYFEGHGPPHLGHFGYSRDHRPDRRQVLLAVATDAQGVPLHVEVLRGKRADSRTLQGLLATLRRRFGITEAIFVFDGGMSSRANLAALAADKLRYVTRLSAACLEALLQELPEEPQLELGDVPRVLDIRHAGKRYVIAGGPWREQRDRERREARLTKAEKALQKLAAVKRRKVDVQKLASQVGRTLERLKAHKYFAYRVDEQGQLHWERKTEAIAREQQHDGWYLLHTNLPEAECSAEQTLSRYKGLLEVEEAFGQLKTYLKVRPVFHYRPDRVRNHVRICFLAYWLSARLGQEWRERGETGEVPRLAQDLQTIRLGWLNVGSRQVGPLMTTISKEHNKLLEKLGLLKLFAAPPNWSV
jgi:transposase